MQPKCVACLSEVVEIDSTQGQTYCGGCGIVLEENTIVSEIAFGESSSGAAVAMGSYVGAGARQSHPLPSLRPLLSCLATDRPAPCILPCTSESASQRSAW